MYETYNKLSEHDIKAYSVKSDAFTIHEDDVHLSDGQTKSFYTIISDWNIDMI